MLNMPSLNETSLLKVYEKIITGFLATFPDEIRVLSESLTAVMIKSFLMIKDEMRPTPQK